MTEETKLSDLIGGCLQQSKVIETDAVQIRTLMVVCSQGQTRLKQYSLVIFNLYLNTYDFYRGCLQECLCISPCNCDDPVGLYLIIVESGSMYFSKLFKTKYRSKV